MINLIAVNNFMLVVICILMCQFSEFTAYDEIKYLSLGLGVHDEHMADQALTFYKVGHIFY